MRFLLENIQPLLSTFPRRLASIKTGAILVIHLAVFALVTAFFPVRMVEGFSKDIALLLRLEEGPLSPIISFQDRFESTTFILLLASLCLSLFLSLYYRIKGEAKRREHNDESSPSEVPEYAPVVAGELQRRGYRTTTSLRGGLPTIEGTRGARGVWGSILFHASILVIVAGITVSKFASFEASVALTEGQFFDSSTDGYGIQNAGPWYSTPKDPVRFRLLRVEPNHRVNGAATTATIVQTEFNGGMKQTPVYVNNGLVVAGRTVHQGAKIGYSPLVVVETADGRQLLNGFTRLATHMIQEREVFKDFVEIPQEDLRIELEFVPDGVRPNQNFSPQPGVGKGPLLHLSLMRDNTAVFDKLIPPGQTVATSGYTVHFAGVRRWSQLDIVDDPAPIVLILGSLLGAVGLAARLLCTRRRVIVSFHHLNGSITFKLDGSTEKFRQTFEEELATLRAAVAGALLSFATNDPDQSGNKEVPLFEEVA